MGVMMVLTVIALLRLFLRLIIRTNYVSVFVVVRFGRIIFGFTVRRWSVLGETVRRRRVDIRFGLPFQGRIVGH